MRNKLKLKTIFMISFGAIVLVFLSSLYENSSFTSIFEGSANDSITQNIHNRQLNNVNFEEVNVQAPIIDISGWQLPQEMDYDQISSQIVGAIVRVQHGGGSVKNNAASTSSGEDKSYKKHIEEFQNRNVPVAVYAYANGRSEKEMRKEARDFYDRAKEYTPTYWWVDVEEETMTDMNAGVEAFRDELESLGVENIGIYTQDWFLSAFQINIDKFNAIWFAHYGGDTGFLDSRPETDKHYELHQYTSQGKLNGYPNQLDFNIATSREDYEKIFTYK
ncbi:glycosyl hydrolase family 25 [Floricoccus tropicus]|uniref:Glycosyl hydrolase family 25 n=1 Tax=Floricoccus tropicus TaxID=1859473 RepID=A0A1E8GN13_9LACT|nr:glycosyl hydrolase family 25 [Floricoccus tropicus]